MWTRLFQRELSRLSRSRSTVSYNSTMVGCGRYALSSRMSSVDREILSPRLFSMGEKLVPVGGAQVLNVCHLCYAACTNGLNRCLYNFPRSCGGLWLELWPTRSTLEAKGSVAKLNKSRH